MVWRDIASVMCGKLVLCLLRRSNRVEHPTGWLAPNSWRLIEDDLQLPLATRKPLQRIAIRVVQSLKLLSCRIAAMPCPSSAY